MRWLDASAAPLWSAEVHGETVRIVGAETPMLRDALLTALGSRSTADGAAVEVEPAELRAAGATCPFGHGATGGGGGSAASVDADDSVGRSTRYSITLVRNSAAG